VTTAALACDDMRILLEIHDPELFDPLTSATYDDNIEWDSATAPNEWAGTGANFNARAFLRGFVLETGRQSNWDDILASTLTIELDNSSGIFAVFGLQHVYTRVRPGFSVELWCKWDGVWYPQFVGEMTEYIEAGEPNDYTVRIKAVDAFRRLQDPIAGEYHAGTDQQPVLERITSLLGMAGMNSRPFVGDTGTATMTNYATSRSILDEIHLTAMSDCGVFFVDKDGTLTYMNRNRVYGRPTSGADIPSFGDGCDGSELPYAAVEPVVADNEFGNIITVANVSQGTDSPDAAKAVDQDSIDVYSRIPWSPSQLLICNAEFVQGIADFHLALRSQAYYRINSFECYPVHDDKLWPILLGMRLYDLVYVTRRPPGAQPLMGLMIVDGMRIEGTPHMWKFTVRCSPASGFASHIVYWDDTNITWDDGSIWA
jgi:hypothetical protein